MHLPINNLSRVNINLALATSLVRSQFPRWRHLPIKPVISSGTVNALFRLGDEMVIRIPYRENAAKFPDKEHVWLPRLAPHLSLSVPVPLVKGRPDGDYPWSWSIYSWLEGADGWTQPIADLRQTAVDLAGFITELQAIDPGEGPRHGVHNYFRGGLLADRDSLVRSAIVELGNRIDTKMVTNAWDLALDQLPNSKDLWIHGDLQPGNLLTRRGTLTAVIDFGLLGVGDPACDLLPAWNLFTPGSRRVFRAAIQVDNATWIRGQGWALYQALLALPYYWDTNPVMVRMSQRIIKEIHNDRST
ncbi:MAG: aminoglycoside phosphotransferase family protein [Proteobacteria bacterium]|nr:aminoglycoside phosphotransferase family protein [Pseudomonadota bacterium]